MDDFQQTVKLKVKSFGQKRLLREKLKEVEEQVPLTILLFCSVSLFFNPRNRKPHVLHATVFGPYRHTERMHQCVATSCIGVQDTALSFLGYLCSSLTCMQDILNLLLPPPPPIHPHTHTHTHTHIHTHTHAHTHTHTHTHSLTHSLTLQVSKLEKKLVNMDALTPSEDALYSQAVALTDKIEWLATEIQEVIDTGKVYTALMCFLLVVGAHCAVCSVALDNSLE
jgi:hypothetical protein